MVYATDGNKRNTNRFNLIIQIVSDRIEDICVHYYIVYVKRSFNKRFPAVKKKKEGVNRINQIQAEQRPVNSDSPSIALHRITLQHTRCYW